MLKIKDNIDLKELEKFGYKFNEYYKTYQKHIDEDETERYLVEISLKGDINLGKFSMINGWRGYPGLGRFIEDIQEAGLVEKVKE